jgi:hypothetical protein
MALSGINVPQLLQNNLRFESSSILMLYHMSVRPWSTINDGRNSWLESGLQTARDDASSGYFRFINDDLQWTLLAEVLYLLQIRPNESDPTGWCADRE